MQTYACFGVLLGLIEHDWSIVTVFGYATESSFAAYHGGT